MLSTIDKESLLPMTDEFNLIHQLDFVNIYYNINDSIILIKYARSIVLNAELAIQVIDKVIELLNQGGKYVLTDATADHLIIEDEARKTFKRSRELVRVQAHAVVVKSLHTRIIINFFARFEASSVLTKVFNRFDPALKFLRSQND